MCKVQGSTDLKNGSCFNKHYFKTIEDKINWGGVLSDAAGMDKEKRHYH